MCHQVALRLAKDGPYFRQHPKAVDLFPLLVIADSLGYTPVNLIVLAGITSHFNDLIFVLPFSAKNSIWLYNFPYKCFTNWHIIKFSTCKGQVRPLTPSVVMFAFVIVILFSYSTWIPCYWQLQYFFAHQSLTTTINNSAHSKCCSQRGTYKYFIMH